MAQLVPTTWRDEKDHRRLSANAINSILIGGTNNAGSVTLTASTTTTVVTDPSAGVDSVVLFMPKTSNAAAEVGNGTMWVSARDSKMFTLTHASNAQSDRNFDYAIIGTGRG